MLVFNLSSSIRTSTSTPPSPPHLHSQVFPRVLWMLRSFWSHWLRESGSEWCLAVVMSEWLIDCAVLYTIFCVHCLTQVHGCLTFLEPSKVRTEKQIWKGLSFQVKADLWGLPVCLSSHHLWLPLFAVNVQLEMFCIQSCIVGLIFLVWLACCTLSSNMVFWGHRVILLSMQI